MPRPMNIIVPTHVGFCPLIATLAAALAASVVSLASADEITWTGGENGSRWEDKNNWKPSAPGDPRRVPTADDDVIIPGDSGVISLLCGAGVTPKKVNSLHLKESASNDESKRTRLTSEKVGAPIQIGVTKDVLIDPLSMIQPRGGGNGNQTYNKVELVSLEGMIKIYGTVRGGDNGTGSNITSGGEVVITAAGELWVMESGTVKGGNGANLGTPGRDTKAPSGGSIHLTAKRLLSWGNLAGGNAGEVTNESMLGLSAGGVHLTATGKAADADDVMIEFKKVTMGKGAQNGTGVSPDGSGTATLKQGGKVNLPEDVTLKGTKMVFNAVKGKVAFNNLGPAAIDMKETVCCFVGADGEILVAGAADGSIVAPGGVVFGGPTDASEDALEAMVDGPVLFSDTPCDACAADVDGNGSVDLADMQLVVAAFGPCSESCSADLNGDDMVDASDVGIVLASMGLCGVE